MWLKKFVRTLRLTTTVLSASCASVQPASSAARQETSLTLPRVLICSFATVRSACSFGSLLVPRRASIVSYSLRPAALPPAVCAAWQ